MIADNSPAATSETHAAGSAPAPLSPGASTATGNANTGAQARKARRKNTAAFKHVPSELSARDRIRKAAEALIKTVDRSRPCSRDMMEDWAAKLLADLGLGEEYLGFTMVLLGNSFWKEQFLAIPFKRRILLLPHCLKHAEGCPAEYDEFGLDCERCGACAVGDYKVAAEKLGYKVLVAEGSPIVLKLIVSGHIDGILGVACLNVLEKAIDKVLLAGVPSYAVPLHSGDCKNTKFDQSWLWEIIDKYKPDTEVRTVSYIPLMRVVDDIFEKRFDELVPKNRPAGQDAFAPLRETEDIALEFLRHGGKRSRPFITLAAWASLSRPESLKSGDAAALADIPASVMRAAVSIEAFHKASLVHDDIEDDDAFRYGSPTLHRRYDLATAINVGDWLIGTGYRLVSRDRKELGAETAADILDRLGQCHLRLCEGQGAELRWRQAADKTLKPVDAIRIYALKTSPAFEAALYSGVRLAGPAEPHEKAIGEFCKHIGVAFQILNDLKDWQGDSNNKLVAGQDALAMRPTLLLALALDAASPADRADLVAMLASLGTGAAEVAAPPSDGPAWLADPAARLNRLKGIYQRAGVFDKAEKLVEKSRERAESVADEVTSEDLRQLLYFLVDTVLKPETEESATAGELLPVLGTISGIEIDRSAPAANLNAALGIIAPPGLARPANGESHRTHRHHHDHGHSEHVDAPRTALEDAGERSASLTERNAERRERERPEELVGSR